MNSLDWNELGHDGREKIREEEKISVQHQDHDNRRDPQITSVTIGLSYTIQCDLW